MKINDDIKASIDFIDSYVKKFNIEMSKPPVALQKLNAEMNIDYSLGDLIKAEGCLFGTLELGIKVELFDEEESFAICKLLYAGLFKADENTPEDVFKQMLELNGVMVLYQLSRSLITSITAQTGMQSPITLPLINIHNVVEKKKGARDNGGES